MANATVAMTVKPFPKGVDVTARRVIIHGTATITANSGTSPATGLPLNWETMTDGNFSSGIFTVPTVGPVQIAAGPEKATFYSNSGATATQQYTYDSTNNSLIVWRAGSAVEAGIVADTVEFEAQFIKNGF